MLRDTHGRIINYLRLAVTDRCNLRCFYCMPEEGLEWLSRADLLTFEEMLRLCRILMGMGVEKIRITGGEPFVRRDIMPFLWELSRLHGLKQLSITTNGVVAAPLVPELHKMGIRHINLSLDTLDRDRFRAITHRDDLPAVMETLDQLLRYGMDIKINAVVMEGKNITDIVPLVELGRSLPVGIRFIEEMPFNGGEKHYTQLNWDYVRILQEIKAHFPNLEKLPDPVHSTSYNYRVPGFKGSVGIIAAYTRSFCGTCNRIRVTPPGMLKTCLYDGGVLNLRDLLRSSNDDRHVAAAVAHAVNQKAADGWEAEKTGLFTSMAVIGG